MSKQETDKIVQMLLSNDEELVTLAKVLYREKGNFITRWKVENHPRIQRMTEVDRLHLMISLYDNN